MIHELRKLERLIAVIDSTLEPLDTLLSTWDSPWPDMSETESTKLFEAKEILEKKAAVLREEGLKLAKNIKP